MNGESEPHPTYKDGHWLTSDQMLFAVQVMLERDDIYSPTAFDMAIKALLNCRAGDQRRGSWVPVVLNTDGSNKPGLHWCAAALKFGKDDKDEAEAVIWDSMAHDLLSAGMKTSFEEAGIAVTLHITGVQHDAWRCGYISIFWQLRCVLLLAQGGRPDQESDPDGPPPGWSEIIWLLCEAQDAQMGDDSQGAAVLSGLGVTDLFRDALESGVVNVGKFTDVLRPYITDQLQSSASPPPTSISVSPSSSPLQEVVILVSNKALSNASKSRPSHGKGLPRFLLFLVPRLLLLASSSSPISSVGSAFPSSSP
jgi:hypothetical protein